MRHAIAIVSFMLAGCGTIEIDPSVGRNFTIEHGTARFQDAMGAAQRHCARMGMSAKHLGTDRGELLLSRFECTAR